MKNAFIILGILITYLVIISLPLAPVFTCEDVICTDLLEELVKNCAIVVLAIVAIKQLKLVKLSGISSFQKWNYWYLLLIPSYLILIGISQTHDISLSQISTGKICLLLFSTLSIGFSEEFVFRGLLQSLFLKMYFEKERTSAAVFRGVFVPAIIFGFFHLLDFDPDRIWSEFAQFFYSIFIGIGFGSILLKTRSLIALAIIHGLINFVFNLDELVVQSHIGSVNTSAFNAILTMSLVCPMLIAGIFIIKKIHPSEIEIK